MTKNQEQFYVILSDGAYSDYQKTYYAGPRKITNEEFRNKGEEIGDVVIEEFLALPTRQDVCDTEERYNPEKPDKWISQEPDTSIWKERMIQWLESEGFEEVEEGDAPEINLYYDVPCSKAYEILINNL